MPTIDELKIKAETLRDEIRAKKQAAMDTTLFAWSQERKVLPAETRDLRVRRILKGHAGKIYAIRWARDGRRLLSASQDGRMILWDGPTTNKLAAITMASSWVMCCDLNDDASLAAAGGLDNICSIYNVTSGERITELNDHTGFLSGVRFLEGKRVLTSSGDTHAILWDLERAVPVQEFTGHSGGIVSLATTRDGTLFATGSCDQSVRVWDVRSGQTVRLFQGHSGDVNALDFFPNGQSLGTGSEDCTARLFDLRSDNEIGCYQHPDMNVGITSVSFSHSGAFFFVAYDDNNFCQWDTMRGTRTSLVAAHEQRISSLAVAPDGSALATGSWDALVKVWV
jgi:guanine nucleotide-binding protein G(I)/G(S)/G(T) subunit beta-1